ncbi:helix-turn-helix transcriptional regulator [Oenococcus sp. UCMA 16435]|nr:helix-turn-helix transcriptional regulator [Oenococcus sp. UCMA 16435]
MDFCSIDQNFKEKNYESKYIRQCKQYVEKHLFQHFSLDDIADQISINKCYLKNQFSKQEGISLKRYIHKERIKAAQNMLKFSNQPISVIANYLCFDSQSHFGAVFKSIIGMTPSNYRMKNMLISSQQNQEA